MTDRDKFALIVNIGGYFVNCGPVVEYICGSLKSIYGLNADRFGYFDLEEEIKKLGVNKYEKIVYRIPDAGVGADSLRDVTDDKGVMEIISCGKNKKTIVQIYVVGGDINDDGADENVEASFQTKSSSQQDTDDGEEVNGLSRAEASIGKELADQLEDINDIIDNFTSVEHGEGDAQTNSACAGLGSQESSDDEDYFPTGVSSSDGDLSDDHLSDDDEYVQARKNLKESRKKVQDWDDDAGYTHPMATTEMDFEEDELCLQKVHNKKSCTLPEVEKPAMKPKGRPRKHTAPHTVVQPPQTEVQPPQTEIMTSPPSETMTSPPVERLTRPPGLYETRTTFSEDEAGKLGQQFGLLDFGEEHDRVMKLLDFRKKSSKLGFHFEEEWEIGFDWRPGLRTVDDKDLAVVSCADGSLLLVEMGGPTSTGSLTINLADNLVIVGGAGGAFATVRSAGVRPAAARRTPPAGHTIQSLWTPPENTIYSRWIPTTGIKSPPSVPSPPP
ncbi:CTC-interacting domain 10 [Striga asiatica]|uniref:CTC-interacting domain 10 n=1 Tax=Striga asiatica TaxID=4170 RepID=A0A5A7QE81_STRAF|nr:CTC-interacting domain 10 [Striga asiatica]